MTSYWHNRMVEEVQTTSSLKFLEVDKLIGARTATSSKSGHLQITVQWRPNSGCKKTVTGIYNLERIQTRNKRQNQQMCLLRQREPEYIIDFIAARCQELESKRRPNKEESSHCYEKSQETWNRVPQTTRNSSPT